MPIHTIPAPADRIAPVPKGGMGFSFAALRPMSVATAIRFFQLLPAPLVD